MDQRSNLLNPKHLAYLLSEAQSRGISRIEATPEAEDEWVQTIVRLSQMNVKYLEACTPGYYNNEGQPAARSLQNGSYGAGPVAFVKVLEDWRAEGSLSGLALS